MWVVSLLCILLRLYTWTTGYAKCEILNPTKSAGFNSHYSGYRTELAQVQNKINDKIFCCCVISFLWFIHSFLPLQPAQGRQVRCQCHHQRAPSSLRQSDRQMDKRMQHHYDKATQTYWRPPSHAVSLTICSTDNSTCGECTLSTFVLQSTISKIWNWSSIKCVWFTLFQQLSRCYYLSALAWCSSAHHSLTFASG